MSQHDPDQRPAHFSKLLRAAREDPAKTMGRLLTNYQDYLHHLANRRLHTDLRPAMDPDDLVQATFLAAWRHFRQFSGESEAAFQVWLRTILNNTFFDFYREYGRQKRAVGQQEPLDPHSPCNPAARHPAGYPTPDEELAEEEVRLALRRCVQQLPKEYRAVLQLRSFDGFPFRRIGVALGISEEAARKRHDRAKETLIRHLSEVGILDV